MPRGMSSRKTLLPSRRLQANTSSCEKPNVQSSRVVSILWAHEFYDFYSSTPKIIPVKIMEWFVIIFGILYLLSKYFKRPKKKRRRPPFKKNYDLDRYQSIEEFEKKMKQGMLKEGKEIFVTAFCNDTHVLNVTATIGSKNTCRPSDNYYNWGAKSKKIGATQIRQYHNHPPLLGRSFISPADKKSNEVFKELLRPYGIEFRSFLVYPSRLGGMRMKEY